MSNGDRSLDEKIELLARQAAKMGIDYDRMLAALRAAVYAPPTEEEIAEERQRYEQK